jgi:SPP1 family predicted phage head-tail adaptor
MARTSHLHTADLRERVTLPGTKVLTELGGGAVTETVTPGAQVWARVQPLQGKEYLEARQIVGGTPHQVTMRHPLPGALKASDAITWRGRTLHLASPPAVDARRTFVNFLAVVRD